MKKTCISAVFVLYLCAGLSTAQVVFHGQAKNSLYSYESESEQSHTRLYQYASFNLAMADGRIQLSSSLRALSDLNETLDSDNRFRAYALHLRLRRLLGRIDLTAGRQFLHPGTVLGALDGVHGRIAVFKSMALQLYAGTESHFSRRFKIYETSDSFVTGATLELRRLLASSIQLLWLQKRNENETFWHLAGLNLDNDLLPETRLRVQAHYNLESEQIHRLLVSTRHSLSDRLAFNLEYKQQQPQVYANSYYTIFSPDAYRQVRAGGYFNVLSDYNINAVYQRVLFDGGEADRVLVSLANANGGIGLLYESGFAGDQLGLMFDYAYNLGSKLTASINLDYSKYRTEEIYEYENQLANAARLTYHLSRRWRIDVEYQWLTNRYVESDSRLLNHISYRW